MRPLNIIEMLFQLVPYIRINKKKSSHLYIITITIPYYHIYILNIPKKLSKGIMM